MDDVAAVCTALFLLVGMFAIGSTGTGPGRLRAPGDEAEEALLTLSQVSLSGRSDLYFRVVQSPGGDDADHTGIAAEADVPGIVRPCAGHLPVPQAANGASHWHVTDRNAASASTTGDEDRARRIRAAEDAIVVLSPRGDRIARDAPNRAASVLTIARSDIIDLDSPQPGAVPIAWVPPGGVGQQMEL